MIVNEYIGFGCHAGDSSLLRRDTTNCGTGKRSPRDELNQERATWKAGKKGGYPVPAAS